MVKLSESRYLNENILSFGLQISLMSNEEYLR